MFKNRDMSVLDWFVFSIIMVIPIINIIFFIILLVSPDTSPSLKNFLIYTLIMTVIVVGLWILILGAVIATFNA